MINVTIWNEYRHEKKNLAAMKMYPEGIHQVIAAALSTDDEINVSTATLDEPEHGLTAEKLEQTDVLFWWGHIAHGEVSDAIVTRVRNRVLAGMGLIVLHSGHYSKIFQSLMGTTGALKWREVAEKERLWNIAPTHPITEGIGDYIELPNTEMYGERFDIPTPDELIFISWFAGGEVFRSGCVWNRGLGKVFYFRPGHETYPIFYNKQVIKVLKNAAKWAKSPITDTPKCQKYEALEKLPDAPKEFGKAGVVQD